MDCRAPGSSVHGILHPRMLEWVATAHDPAIPFFGIYLKKMKTLIQKISTSVFTAVLFTWAKIGKQTKCPSTNEWIKKIHTHTYTHTHTHTHTDTLEYYSTTKKKGNLAICTKMDGSWGHYAKWNKSEREGQILYNITYRQDLKQSWKQADR